MSQSLRVKSKTGLLQVGRNVTLNDQGTLSNGTSSLSLSSGGIVLPHSSVTQLTSATTGVETEGSSGVITTFASTLASELSSSFTVSNESVTADSVVLVSIVDYSGVYATNGLPIVSVNSVVQGGFDVVLINAHGTAPLAGTVSISFLVV